MFLYGEVFQARAQWWRKESNHARSYEQQVALVHQEEMMVTPTHNSSPFCSNVFSQVAHQVQTSFTVQRLLLQIARGLASSSVCNSCRENRGHCRCGSHKYNKTSGSARRMYVQETCDSLSSSKEENVPKFLSKHVMTLSCSRPLGNSGDPEKKPQNSRSTTWFQTQLRNPRASTWSQMQGWSFGTGRVLQHLNEVSVKPGIPATAWFEQTV